MTTASLRARVENALRTYNKYREPEVVAELSSIEQDGKRFEVRFTGSFCRTCGFYDYFEDLIYDLLDGSDIKTKIVDVKEEWETENFRVTYQIDEPRSQDITTQKERR